MGYIRVGVTANVSALILSEELALQRPSTREFVVPDLSKQMTLQDARPKEEEEEVTRVND